VHDSIQKYFGQIIEYKETSIPERSTPSKMNPRKYFKYMYYANINQAILWDYFMLLNIFSC